MATIIITRPKQFINRLRSYRILVNGEELTTVNHNEHKTLELPSGTYTLKAKIDWVSSPEYTLTVNEKETQTLEIGCSRKVSRAENVLTVIGFIVLFGSIGLYETITPTVWAVLIGLWLIRDVGLTKGKSFLYYLTKGRSNYLYIKPLATVVSQ